MKCNYSLFSNSLFGFVGVQSRAERSDNVQKPIFFCASTLAWSPLRGLRVFSVPRRGDPTHFGGQASVSAGHHRNVSYVAFIMDPIPVKELRALSVRGRIFGVPSVVNIRWMLSSAQ